MGNGDERDVEVLRAVHGEDAAIDLVFGGGGDLVVVGGEELDARVVEGEGAVAVVGDDDADGEQAVLEVGEAEEGAGVRVVAGVGCDGDLFVGMGVVGGVLGGGFGGWGGFGVGLGGERDGEESDGEEGEEVSAVGVHAGMIMSFADTVVKPGVAAERGAGGRGRECGDGRV